MSSVNGQPPNPWPYKIDWEFVSNLALTYFFKNSVVIVIPTILHFVGRTTFPFILGAVLFNTLVSSVRLAWRQGLYDNSVGSYYYEAIRPQRYYIGTRIVLLCLGAPIKLLCRLVWWYLGPVLGIVVVVVFAHRAQLLNSLYRRVASIHFLAHTNQLITGSIWTIGTVCELLIGFLSITMQFVELIIRLPDQCLKAVCPKPSPQQYQYHPIQPGSIRLLKVDRKLPLIDLKTSLVVTDIASAPPYHAISYTWGTTSDTREISVDGQPCQISVATYNAIYGCSSIWRSNLFWIDYLCINQQDVTEKADQVSNMIKVYENAEKVIVYLGHFTWRSILPLSLFWDIFHHVEVQTEANWLYRRYEPEVMLPRWKSLIDFFNHPWFSRVWILQEVAAAQEVVVYYGGLAFSWATFMGFNDFFASNRMAHLLQMRLRGRSAYNGVDNLRHINRLRVYKSNRRAVEAAIGGRNGALLTLAAQLTKREDPTLKWKEFGGKVSKASSLDLVLTENAHFKASDPRDKIYALQGLTSTSIPPEIRPDYRKSIETLCVDVAKYFWSSNDPLNTIAWAGIGHERNLKLPSWAADWTIQPKTAPLTSPGYNNDTSSIVNYAASGDTEPRISLHAIDEGAITFQGVFVDEIVSLARICTIPGDETDDYITDANGTVIYPRDFLEQQAWHSEIVEMAIQNIPPEYMVARINAFWRTLIGDITNTERPAPAELGLTYSLWGMGLEYMKNWYESRDENATLPLSDDFWDFLNVGAVWAPRTAMCSNERRFGITEAGYMCQVLPNSQVGDMICVACGAQTPWVIRPVTREGVGGDDVPSQQRYQFVGECFVYGIMDGEMMDESLIQSFVLV